MQKKSTLLTTILILPVLAAIVLLPACSYHQRNSHRLVNLTVDEQDKNNDKNFLYSQQAYGGSYQKDPELTAYVNQLGQKIVRQQDLPSNEFTFIVVNSSIPNIWSFPKGKIALTRGLLVELKNEAELMAILAHEVAHVSNNHGAENIQEVEINAGPVNLNILADAHNKEFLVGALGSGSGLVTLKYNLQSEMQADKNALMQISEMGYSTQGLSDFNERVYQYHVCKNCNWKGGFLAKHPTSEERIQTSRELISKQSLLGATEVNLFNQKMENLRQQAPVYEKLDEGYHALLHAKYATAVQLAEQGLDIDPTEFHFYLLKGKAFFKLGYTLDALNTLNRAIEINPRYFDNYLQRGLVKEQLDDFAQASNDLERSLSLLPTAEAYYALGEIDYHQDHHHAAIQNFRKASISNTPGGQKATSKLKELGLALHGIQTLDVESLFTEDGFINIKVCNMGLSTLRNVVIDVDQLDAKGKLIYRHLIELDRELLPFESVCHQTNIGPFFNEEHMKKSTLVSPIYSE